MNGMELSDEWKSLLPISSVFSAPLLLSGGNGDSTSNSKSKLGPLIFNPSPQTLALLLCSPTLSPRLPPPFPHLFLSTFLSTVPSRSDPSSLLPSTSSSVASSYGRQLPDPAAALRHNNLQLLRCPGTKSVLVFFPTGDNSDQVGFVVVSVEDSKLNVKGEHGTGVRVSTAKNNLNHRILRLLVNPVAHYCSASGNSNSSTTIGYLLACTMYGVHWFSVKTRGLVSDSERYLLEFSGSKVFKGGSVVNACWSPYLPEESVVLLESGELFLFDLDDCSETKISSSRFVGKRLKMSWRDSSSLGKNGWLGCDFSWHPRILIVAHSSAVFLLDFRCKECNVTCLQKIDTLALSTSAQNDRFVAFSKAGSDGFLFCVASSHWLLLCDVRKPLMPLLQWAHDVASPSYVTVFSLSELRSHSKTDPFKWASEFGNCIIMGSFWNCEFSLFFYGPLPRDTVASEISKFCNTLYAWELPLELSLSGRECNCGSCLLREEFLKDSLPEWIDWRQKKEIVLGFGILDKDLHVELSEPDGFGGFTLIRWMSSGKMESQRYFASWESVKMFEEPHKKSPQLFEDSLLYAVPGQEYKFRKRFQYLKLDYLNAYMKDNLDTVLIKKVKEPCKVPCKRDSLSADFHQSVCEKLKKYGFHRLSSVSDVLKHIRVPSSIHEIALNKIWTGVPFDLLQSAFYLQILEVLLDHRKVSLEFLDIPRQPQLPPFLVREPSHRSSKWSQKVRSSSAFVGPVLPTPALLTICELRKEEVDVFSANAELGNQCSEVLELAIEITSSVSGSDIRSEHAVSLGDDCDEICDDTQRVNLFSVHKLATTTYEPSTQDAISEDSVCNDEAFTTFISRNPEKDLVSKIRTGMEGPEMFNSLSPIELEFNVDTMSFGNDVKTYKLLKRQFSMFLQSFDPYREFLDSCNLHKQDL